MRFSDMQGVKKLPRRIPDAIITKILELLRTKYVGYGPTFAAEKLLEKQGIVLIMTFLEKL